MNEDDLIVRKKFVDNLTKLTQSYKTDAEFSRAVDLAPDRVSKLKKADGNAQPMLKELVAISKVCNVSIDWLLGVEHHESESNDDLIVRLRNNAEMFKLILDLEKMLLVKLKYHYEEHTHYGRNYETLDESDVSTTFDKEENRIDISVCDVDLQATLYKWVEYKKKFSDDSEEYVDDVLETVRLGLTKKLESLEREKLPFN